ncbi:HNH endonuclease, partial [Blastococcus sp. CT_GayMR20]|uniref:HNH endonuclease signature motif containing protein n=1 Tax=Blastococcus sp. CT_GayMR20 TaxID=2559609 RepID=UPI0010732C95
DLAAVLGRPGRQTVAALRACVRRAVARIDAAAAADRLITAVRRRQVRLDAREDGMSALTASWAAPLARACHAALSAYAKACEVDEDGTRDPRTHDQRMADCLADLILRPHADHPVVRVALTVVAGVDTLTGHGEAAEEPGEIDGDLVPAALVRELAHTLGLLPRPQPATAPEPTAEPATGKVAEDGDPGDRAVDDDLAELRAEELAAADELRTTQGIGAAARAAVARLLDVRRLIDTALAARPRIAVTDRLSGALLALTDSTEIRATAAAGRGLDPPAGTAAYRPTDPLHRFVELRDRRCRFPGCRVRARCCDLDHQIPHPHGPTTHDNLACLCEHHHRLSHQAPGWRLHRDPDGGLTWTLPSGHTLTTQPPAFGTDDGSTPTAPRTGRQRYADTLATIRDSRPAPPGALTPF